MAFLEKSNWVVLVVAVLTLVVYILLVAPQVVSKPITEVAWVQPMTGAIIAFVVAVVLGHVAAAASNPSEGDRTDQRDREIDQYGERAGNWVVIAGAIAALVLAMARADHFWIANAIFLGGLAGAGLSSVTKIAAYRGPFQGW